MRIVPIAIASVALLAGAGVAAKVSGPQAAQVMHLRHEGMENIGKNFKVLNRELNVSSPDVGTVRSSAASITKLAFQSGAWFPEGTGPEVGKTGAKPDIWLSQNRADFAAKLHNFQIAAPRFNAAAMGNDLGATRAQFKELAGTCKACHDKYRTEMHH